jgi:hypothetical protein
MRLKEICLKGCALWLLILVSGSAVVSMAHEWMAPSDEAMRPNPAVSDTRSIERGKIVYLDNELLRSAYPKIMAADKKKTSLVR